jgi:hypothetical protein
VEYYYAEVDTWHTTHADGVEVFYFATGQTEAHHPDGLKARPSANPVPTSHLKFRQLSMHSLRMRLPQALTK